MFKKKTNCFLTILQLTGVDVRQKFRLKGYQSTDSNRDMNFGSPSEPFLDRFERAIRLTIDSNTVSKRFDRGKLQRR